MFRGLNNAQSLDMTKSIFHLIINFSHKFPQFQALPGHFVKKKKIQNYLVPF